MANPSKAKGTAAEVAVRDTLRDAGYTAAERLPTEGARDRGDIAGVPVVIEVKACREMDLAGWLREADREASNARLDIGVVWHKRRGTTDPLQWYVTMTGADFLKFLEAYENSG